MAVSTEEIISAIDGMTILELKQLSDALKEKYGVTAMAAAPAAARPRQPQQRPRWRSRRSSPSC